MVGKTWLQKGFMVRVACMIEACTLPVTSNKYSDQGESVQELRLRMNVFLSFFLAAAMHACRL